jgi:hypothetical protein
MKIVLVIIFFVGAILSFLLFGYLHEQVHVQIYRGYGIESKIGIDFPDLVTTAEKPCPSEECELAHNLNEVVSYPLQAIFLFMILFGIITITFCYIFLHYLESIKETIDLYINNNYNNICHQS